MNPDQREEAPSKSLVMEAVQWLKPAMLCAHRDPALKETVVKLLSTPHVIRNLEYPKTFAELKTYAEQQGAVLGDSRMKDALEKLEELGSAFGDGHKGSRELRPKEAFGAVPSKSERDGVAVPALEAAQEEGSVETGKATDSAVRLESLAAGSGVNDVHSQQGQFWNEALWHMFLIRFFGMY